MPGFLQTKLLELRPNSSTLVSSDRFHRLTRSCSGHCAISSDLFSFSKFLSSPHRIAQPQPKWPVVPNVFHLRIMVATVLLGNSKRVQLFYSLPQTCAWTKSWHWTKALACIVSCETVYRQLYVFPNPLQSIIMYCLPFLRRTGGTQVKYQMS